MLAARRPPAHLACLLACCAVASGARAADLGDAAGWDIRWDTTIRVSLGLRAEPANAALLAGINADDGDRAFTPGPESERLDAVTEITGERDKFGFDLSAQGWYDAAYNTQSANNSPATFNPVTSSPRGFPADVRTLMGRDAELLNAYVRGTQDAGSIPVTVSIGRQTLLWGESLLFAENGIAAAQAPVDEIKSLSAPLAEARELFLPVTQIVVRAGLANGFSLEAYDQLEWRRNRLPGVGSFFSTADILDEGGQRFLAANGVPELYRAADQIPHGIGQFGIALRHTGGALDWGLYALRADARSPTVELDPAHATYTLAFPRGMELYGASLSTYAGDANIAGEVSLHRNAPLDATTNLAAVGSLGSSYGGGTLAIANPPYNGPPRANPPQPPIARGTTVNAQASVQTQLPPGKFADGVSVQAELAGNQLLDATTPAGRTRFAAGLRAIAAPQYFQVLKGLDLSVPFGFGIGLAGHSAVDASQNEGAGFVSIGVTATFHVVWQGSAAFTHFIGGPGAQPLADRDFAEITVTRSF